MIFHNLKKIYLFTSFLIFGCTNNKIILDDGNEISIEFLEGLNDNPEFQLSRDSNGYYELELDKNRNQTIQRISGKLLRYGMPVEDISSGSQPKKIDFSSNLYWWLLEGDIVANITYTYINSFSGELTYVNLPPLLNWKDILIPTINSSGYSDPETGVFNTVIAPIREMVGDTMKIKVEYTHTISSKEEGSMFFEILGERIFKDSTYIILK
jgi:hypothetical protein